MKVCVTGSEGFIGRHVVSRLRRRGDIEEIFRIDKLEPRVHGEDPDADEDLILHAAHETPHHVITETDVLVHLAAQVSVADSMEDPFRYLRENTLQTTELLQKFRTHGDLDRIVVASSMSIYGPGGPDTSESEPARPTSIYGLTKFDQERLAHIYSDLMNCESTALRYFNVYGPGQALDNPYTGVIANFANWLLNDQQPIVYEDGQQTRDFVFVEDVADVTARAAVGTIEPGTYNVCTGEATTIEDVARTLARALDKDIEPKITHEYRPGDVRHCTGDPSALAEQGWEAEWSFREGIRAYGRWLTSEHG